jgi:hypothetical protein
MRDMSKLRQALHEYLAVRRALGFRLKEQARELHNFVDFAEEEKASFITRDLSLRWATRHMPSRYPGRFVWALYAASRSIAVLRTFGRKFRHQDSYLTAIEEGRPMYTAKRISRSWSRQPNNSGRHGVCEPRLSLRCLDCWQSPVCGSANA